jgi:hypothetical protein
MMDKNEKFVCNANTTTIYYLVSLAFLFSVIWGTIINTLYHVAPDSPVFSIMFFGPLIVFCLLFFVNWKMGVFGAKIILNEKSMIIHPTAGNNIVLDFPVDSIKFVDNSSQKNKNIKGIYAIINSESNKIIITYRGGKKKNYLKIKKKFHISNYFVLGRKFYIKEKDFYKMVNFMGIFSKTFSKYDNEMKVKNLTKKNNPVAIKENEKIYKKEIIMLIIFIFLTLSGFIGALVSTIYY